MPGSEFADLLQRAQHGDELAFNTIFRQTQPIVLKYLAAITGMAAAEDIASETWVSVVRDLGNFVGDEPAAFRAWVLSIARRRWVDDIRKRSRRPEVLVDEAPDFTPAAEEVESEADRSAGTRWALAQLAILPPDQAEIIALRVIADLDVHTTAEIVGKSPGAVRVTAHRALRRLAEHLSPAVTDPTTPTIEQ